MLGNQIIRLRKEKGITQETLAGVLGVSMQAVSKWENDSCCPDIGLLVPMADYFGVTLDTLFGRTPPREESEYSGNLRLDLPADDKLRIVQVRNGRVLDQREWEKDCVIPLAISAEDLPGKVLELEVWGSISVEGDVNGNVNAGAQVQCDGINGNVNAGGQVQCDEVNGNVSVGGQVQCDEVNGNVSAGSWVECGDVGSNVECRGNVECGNIEGDVLSCNSLSCDNISGDVRCQGNIECDTISGDVECQGSIRYKSNEY